MLIFKILILLLLKVFSIKLVGHYLYREFHGYNLTKKIYKIFILFYFYFRKLLCLTKRFLKGNDYGFTQTH